MENRGKSIASMALGIASIALCESIVGGLVCAIIGLVLSKQAVAMGGQNGFNKAGKITSIIGLVFAVVAIVAYISVCAAGCATLAGISATTSNYYY